MSVYPMLISKSLPGVSLRRSALWISWSEVFTVSLGMTRCDSRRNSPSTWSRLKLGGMQPGFWSYGKQSNRVKYISDIRRCILWAIYQSQFREWVPGTISSLIFLNGHILAMWKRRIDLPTNSSTFNRCSITMTGVPVRTIWRRHCRMFPFKAGTILT